MPRGIVCDTNSCCCFDEDCEICYPPTAEEKVARSHGGSVESGLSMQTDVYNDHDYERHPWHRNQHGTTRGD